MKKFEAFYFCKQVQHCSCREKKISKALNISSQPSYQSLSLSLSWGVKISKDLFLELAMSSSFSYGRFPSLA